MVTGVIPTIQPPQSGVSAERARERLDFLVPYDVPGGYSYTPPQPEMNTLGLLADPNIGPQSIVAVPLGRAGVVGERTGVINPAIQEETAAQQYMRQAQEMRQARIDEKDPARVTNRALRDGNNAGESKLLERMARSGLLSTLQNMARAERQYGVGPLAAFSESALDVQAARSAAEQKQREMGLELAKERLKAGDGKDAIRKMLAKGETQKLLSTAGNTFKMINASEKIRKILGTKGASGLANAAKSWATQFGNIFGFNLKATSRQDVEDIIGMLEQQMAGSRIFGRDLNRNDYEVLAKVLKSPGIVESDERIRNQYRALIDSLEQTHAQSVKSLNILIGRDTTQQLLRQSKVTGNLFTEVKQ